jgi:biopolymer transport protein ExbD
MADTPRTLDVWIVDRNMVYQKVPYTVVGDWLVEGRLLGTDRVRGAGTNEPWLPLSEHALLSSFIPKPDPKRADDTAEAYEPIDMEITVKKPGEAEDDDVDMIPLIDISMVLLVFFMMTASNLVTASPVLSPEARNTLAIDAAGSFTVNIKLEDNGKIDYYFGDNFQDPMTEQEMLRKVESVLKDPDVKNFKSKAVIKASATLPYEKVQQMTVALKRAGVKTIQAQVREKRGGGDETP